ncbi:MAG: hypothetical protein ACYSVY_13550 [Planctomycetota bacterium]|jgi:hypothetical protein
MAQVAGSLVHGDAGGLDGQENSKGSRGDAKLDRWIGRRIRQERLRRKLAIRQTAERAGMSTS